jgi:molecular chaperone GrpE
MAKKLTKHEEELLQKLAETMEDLQRTRADFENYRKRTEAERQKSREYGQTEMASKLLPVIDDIERAITHLPAELADNAWAKGVAGLTKNLDKTLASINITRIIAETGSDFNPDQHHAVQFDNADGEHEVIAEELQSGYLFGSEVLRPAMVQVTRK